ncbi:hypothetical protein [Candidatus Borrarchaeum sp.]|uniref:hypothetical protein n=1 Tax=Candidatus Borrarchaeum sp. TaxID=2846742 RepID=UPI00257B21DF|nr:hypothetical protein [Candidatus Borrarchaeum sp.]
MLKLQDLTNVRKKPVCFCGRTLVKSSLGEFCEIHGTDIRIDPIFVDASFQITDLEGEPLHDHFLNESFPQNQFLRLFRSSRQKNLGITQEEVIYDVRLSPSSTKETILELIEDFLGELEVDNYFFGYIPFRSFQIRRSGIAIYYLFRFQIVASHKVQFYFTVLPLRRLSDYISWRLHHCHGNIQNIQTSLQTNRSSVFLSNGDARQIKDIQWDSSKALPSKIILNDPENQNAEIFEIPSRLYQNRTHFFLGTKTENEMISSLKEIAYQFVNDFQRYLSLRFQSVTADYKKVKDEVKFEDLLGKFIYPNVQFLRTVGEKQNKIMTEKGLLKKLLLNPKTRKTRALLVVSCSATKSSQINSIPALLRYLGKTFLFLKHLLLENSWPTHVDLLIVSAKFGLVKPKEPIPFYEQQLTPETVSTTEQKIDDQIENQELEYVECFVNLPKLYLKAIKSLENALQSIGCSIKKIVENQTKRNIAMIRWLYQRVIDD